MDEFTKVVNEVQNDDFVGGDVQDNAIEFLRGADTAVATFSQGKFINKMRRLAEEYPDDVEIEDVKNSSAIVCRFPATWVKVSPPRKREFTEEERLAAAERLRAYRSKNTQ
jgi:hypothetical protein